MNSNYSRSRRADRLAHQRKAAEDRRLAVEVAELGQRIDEEARKYLARKRSTNGAAAVQGSPNQGSDASSGENTDPRPIDAGESDTGSDERAGHREEQRGGEWFSSRLLAALQIAAAEEPPNARGKGSKDSKERSKARINGRAGARASVSSRKP